MNEKLTLTQEWDKTFPKTGFCNRRIERLCRIIVHDPSMGALHDMDCCGKSPCLTRKILVHPASPGYEYRF